MLKLKRNVFIWETALNLENIFMTNLYIGYNNLVINTPNLIPFLKNL